ncbi:hypothetical protein JCM3765_007246 [Sporobolomyces pararoseus]
MDSTTTTESRQLRIANLQSCPIFKNPSKSLKRIDELIEPLKPGSIDFLVLPEMATTGYCFKNREDIAPWIEEVPAGKTSKWAMKTARKLGCYIQVGIPTLKPLQPDSNNTTLESDDDLYYNSIILVNPRGKIQLVYHKTFLFETDQTWASSILKANEDGDRGFVSLDLEFPPSSNSNYSQSESEEPNHEKKKTFRYSPAICMDLNGKTFERKDLEKLEYSNFVTREKVDLVIASNAWLDSESEQLEEEQVSSSSDTPTTTLVGERNSWENVKGLIGYWVYRMSTNLEGEPGVGFVVSNRIGREGDCIFAGSSCIIELGDKPTVLKHASKNREELIIATVRLPVRD